MQLPTLTMTEYSIVFNILSFTIATMGAAALFFFLAAQTVESRYRLGVYISGLVVAIACYHYVQIFLSWNGAYTLQGGAYVPTGKPFNPAYRYVDWLLTVPLLLTELVAVLNLPRNVGRPLQVKLIIAAILMIVLGYPGEIATAASTKWLWWAVAMVPFLFIVYTLFAQLSAAVGRQPERVRDLVAGARWLTVVSWSFYPIAYLAPVAGLSGSTSEVVLQIGYSIADIVSKAGLGLYIYGIARTKSETVEPAVSPA